MVSPSVISMGFIHANTCNIFEFENYLTVSCLIHKVGVISLDFLEVNIFTVYTLH